MHLGNGAITPECMVLTYGAAAAGLAAGAAAIRRAGVTTDKLIVAAGLGSLVLAAQAVNVPIAPGMSGHFVGGALVAAVLGPGLGASVMAAVVTVQAAVLGDGGIAALGANIINMAILPAGLVALARGLSGRGDGAASRARLATTAALAVPLAAVAIAVETAAFRPAAELAGWTTFAGMLLMTHFWIGLLEALATWAALAAWAWLGRTAPNRSRLRPAAALLVGALLLAALAPVSSALPDGYEAAALAAGTQHLLGQ